jgi:hypothetical protein
VKQLYKSYDETVEYFTTLQQQHPDLFKVETIGQTWENRAIILVTISQNVQNADQKPALFYTGTIHAREWIGIELARGFGEYVSGNIDYDPLLQESLERSTIYMVPCANPDGFEYSREHFSFWRKNRRQNADGTFGVDLNRNFPIGFRKQTDTSSNIYGGPEPFSEPETAALRDFVDAHPNISIALDYHSQGNVFFPAHDFRHEDTIDTTDMNALCANMADEIKKVSKREYGIHQGKPPATLISGSGREFYYSKGIISTVVEVGSRNISDYLDDMSENIKEHIPALLWALRETPNYASSNQLERVENFMVDSVSSSDITLKWDACEDENIYYEIYRSEKDKQKAKSENIVAKIRGGEYTDTNLESAQEYFYMIRAVDKKTKVRSPFAPRILTKTKVAYDEFDKSLFCMPKETGYIAQTQNAANNEKHFGKNSLFVGIDERRGVSYGLVTFDLSTLPENAKVKYAKLFLYPMNRVSATVEKYGEWNVGLIQNGSIDNIHDFSAVDQAEIKTYVGRAVKSNQLTQGIWRQWKFSHFECQELEGEIKNGKVQFRVDGPSTLSVGRKSQMMQWDIGYGQYGAGLNFRPRLDIVYTLEKSVREIHPSQAVTLKEHETILGRVQNGFDKNGKKIYSHLSYDLSSLPPYNNTVITRAYLKMEPTNTYIKNDTRFHVEMVKNLEDDYERIDAREVIQNIGYDVGLSELQKSKDQFFVFDTLALIKLNYALTDEKKIDIFIEPTSSRGVVKNAVVNWSDPENDKMPTLVVEYLNKRRKPVAQVQNVNTTIENGKIKLTWNNPKDKDFVGVRVVKNRFRVPHGPYDGQKIYAGKDAYTYDSFGAIDLDKYFALFTYDNVPNYSEPVIIKYKVKKS